MPPRSVAVPLPWTDPAALFAAGPARAPHAFWLDAGPDAASGWSWLGAGHPASGTPREVALAASAVPAGRAPDAPAAGGPFRGGHVGWLGYDAAAAAAGAPAVADPGDGPQEAWLRVERLIAFDHAARRAWVIAPETDIEGAVAEAAAWQDAATTATTATAEATAATEPTAPSQPRIPNGVGDAGSDAAASARHTPAQYRDLIARCRDAIRAGDAYQLCLTTRFTVPVAVDPVTAYLRLRAELPAHHGAFIRIEEHALLSASPERFLEVADGIVRTRPIKGTRPRGTTPASDAALARELRDSVKEQAENVMIVDLMRNDLQRVCLPGSVAAERLLEVESFAAVHQLVSTVAGRLRSGTTFADVLAAGFPAGSMTGAPKLSAMTILHELEAAPRGVYAGCFGWVGDDGRADLAMTIRSVVTHPGGAYVGAGGGITWLSDPDAEVAEVAVKARGPLAALGAALPEAWAPAHQPA